MGDDDVTPLERSNVARLSRSGYSATSLVQNTQAYGRDGRVRAGCAGSAAPRRGPPRDAARLAAPQLSHPSALYGSRCAECLASRALTHTRRLGVRSPSNCCRMRQVRTSQELERTITRRMSVDPATLHPARPVLSADELTGARLERVRCRGGLPLRWWRCACGGRAASCALRGLGSYHCA